MPTVSADVERLQRRLASGGYGMELPPNIVADLSRVARGLHRLQGVLTAAEKQPFEASRELRLRKIKQHVYDVEDILDDLEDGSIRGRKLQENSNLWSQAVFFFSLNHSVVHCRMVKKMKKIRKSLDHESEDSLILSLLLHHRAYEDRNCDEYMFDKTAIIGRDNDKENLRALVLSNSEHNFSIIPIVGLGGLGKTVLAQLIFSDKDVRCNFDRHIWIDLNMSCNLHTIASKIISEANRTVEDMPQAEEEIEDNPQIIMNRLREVLNEKRCLIVLDGLWSTDEGQLLHLKKMLRGTENTKIIVTTCSENVAKLMHTNQLYKLGPLSEEHCWAVFSQRAFRGGVNSDFTRMGKQILNMCEGIPAVAHCLGSLMHDKGMGIWNDEKASLWKLERQFPFQVNMFSSIKQIYYNMPSALKSCLNHLSMFPKGSVVRMENLIRQWAALGILGSTHGSLPVYSQGKKYIHELLSVFFLEEPNQSSGSRLNCASASKVLSMHNLVQEFARYVTSHDLFTMDGERKNNDSTNIYNSRYASLTRCNEESKIRRAFLTSVRGICLKDCAGAKLIEKLFSALKHLHVLDISRCSFMEIPSSICQLTHLRYIDISSSAIQALPEQMSSLQNLEALDLSETCIEELPDFVGTFHKLKYLNLQGCRKIHHLSSKLDIKSLQHLNLSCCPAAHQLIESISGFQELRFLDISSCTELRVLPESFGRLTNLEDLVLSNCTRLKKLPESFGELCFLQFLNVSGCCKLEEVPASFGRLASLEVLILSRCSRIRSLPQSLIDIAFLRILDLAGCVDLHINLGMLPSNNLENLNVDGCRKIYAMPGWTVNFPKLHPRCLQTCDQQIRCLITDKQVCPTHSEVEISKELNVPVHDEIEEAMASQPCQQAGNSECTTKGVIEGSSACTSYNVPQHRTTPTVASGDLQSRATSGGSSRAGSAPAGEVPVRYHRHRSQLHEPVSRRTGEARSRRPRKLQSAGTSSSGTGAIGFACWPRKTQKHFSDEPAKEDAEGHPGQVQKFSLQELQVATDNFSKKNIIGRGGFGKIYKGMLADGSLVAVKREKEERTPVGELQFQTEVGILSMVAHRNLLRLCGFCMTPTERMLVYAYMSNGSVASHLRERPGSEPPLDWQTRRRIALGSARGLSYLHDNCDPRIIHGDVKAANILLDEDFEAVVGDFGLAKLMDNKDTDINTEVSGTIGHIAPEYLLKGKSSEKTDVFGYGIMLLELLTGQRAIDLTRVAKDDNASLLDWVKGLLENKKLEDLVDNDLKDNYVEDEVESLIQIALLCTQSDPIKRPKMSEVVRMLEGDGPLAERWERKKLKSAFNLRATIGTSSSGTGAIGFPSWPLKMQKHLSDTRGDQKRHLGQDKQFSLRELQVATDNFSERNIIGRGAFGKIYRGTLANRSLVAVKRKEERTHIGELQFQTEVHILSMVIHRNILRLHGFCKTRKEMLLVYAFMANGSVGSRLRERPVSEPPLDWQTRRRIALGSARGLSYLHYDCEQMIIHGDVKVANIWLDEDFEAVLGEFDLAQLMDNDDSNVMTEVIRGTIGHIAPEYFATGQLSDKTDVFSYGIMLLELVTGQYAQELARVANNDNARLLDWVKGLLEEKKLDNLVDNNLNGKYIYVEVESLIQIALLCTQSDPKERPNMIEVVRMLEGDVGLAERWEEWKKLQVVHQVVELSSPPREDWIVESAYDPRAVELSGPR